LKDSQAVPAANQQAAFIFIFASIVGRTSRAARNQQLQRDEAAADILICEDSVS